VGTNGKERRPTTKICALPNKPKHGEGLPTCEGIPPPYPLGRSSEATFPSTRQRSGNGTSSCIASGSTVDLSLHESDCHLPTRPPHPRKSPPLCYFSLTARDLLIHYAWSYYCFVEYTVEGLTDAVSRPSLSAVIRFSDPKTQHSAIRSSSSVSPGHPQLLSSLVPQRNVETLDEMPTCLAVTASPPLRLM
jgi:hypothetical protein